MSILHPFRAVRPIPECAPDIACVPYDVVNAEEARRLAEGNPKSFLHVIRPEIDFADGVNVYGDSVYAKGAENLDAYVAGPDSLQEDEPSLYVYRLIMNGRPQTGIVGCVAVSDYDSNVILKHEKTRPAKENDRTRHIISQRAHAEPIMLTFGDHEGVGEILNETVTHEPLYDFTAPDGIQHTIWRIAAPGDLVSCFEEIDRLYVADGHHRCKAASRAAEELAGTGDTSMEVGFFPAVLFPMGNMEILAYNRIVRKLPVSKIEFLVHLKKTLPAVSSSDPIPERKGEIAVYLDGQWTGFKLPVAEDASVVDRLDVGLLSANILVPMLNITDPRTDSNIDFVGGIRGTKELEELVDSGQAEMAISMYPTSIRELVDVSDADLLMPPKSTWFEPKLRSGLLVHLF
ncbi:MAG: DUF1015 domain-containing protein [Bacteroidetes bacterium]|nr:MAG: DUF1015 domain-containing protein [Bacteroidota bacterium]